ncbi:MAG TPA: Xaa-Pro peptidase family protein, partial [Nitrospirota bacterium]
MDYRPKRLGGLRKAAEALGVEGFLVTSLPNVHYLTGFSGSSGYVLVSAKKAVFMTDSRYQTQSRDEVQGYDISIQKGRWTADVSGLVKDMGVRKLGFESRDLTFEAHSVLSKALEGVELVPSKDAVEKLRLIKDEGEIEKITEAIRRAELGFRENLSRIAPGMVERDASLGLEFNIRNLGSLKMAFDTIIASGSRAALPHGIASDKVMEEGDTVIIDYGAEAFGYHSDITRSGVLGKPDGKQREIFDIVAESQRRAIEKVKPGVSCKEVDEAARGYISSKGYGDFFGHGLGHGVGLEVHEGPGVSYLSEDVVAEGMVFTIEPGIYIPDWGGFRIEDMVLVTKGGCRVLTSL